MYTWMFQTWKSYFLQKLVSPLESIAFHCVLSAQEIASQGRVLSRQWGPTDLKRYTRGKGTGQKWGERIYPKLGFARWILACESYHVFFCWHFTNGAFWQPKSLQGWLNLGIISCGRCVKSHRFQAHAPWVEKLYFSTVSVFVVYSDLDDAHSGLWISHFKISTACLRVVGSKKLSPSTCNCSTTSRCSLVVHKQVKPNGLSQGKPKSKSPWF